MVWAMVDPRPTHRICRREDWASAAAQLARAIDYPNFKNAVADRQGFERAHMYSGVWGLLRGLQKGGRYG